MLALVAGAAVARGEVPSAPRDARYAGADAILQQAARRQVFPGAVLAVGRRSGLVHVRAVGRLSREPESPATSVDAIYDLASITKAVATTTAAALLVEDGRLDLDSLVDKHLPAFPRLPWQPIRVRDLLTHSSGLPAWAPLYREARGRDGVLSRIAALEPEYEAGSRSLYSDLGMILLGAIVEHVSGETLDVFAERRVFARLGMKDTRFRPGPQVLPRVAPTSVCPWRGRKIHGEVRDENAYVMGGVAGHAGLFSTSLDLALFAQMMLNGGQLGEQRLLKPETVSFLTSRCAVPGSTRTLGWEMAAGDAFAGAHWSEKAYGHTGLTGTMLWLDPEKDIFVILLANRDPLRDESDEFRTVRRDICDRILRAIDGSGGVRR